MEHDRTSSRKRVNSPNILQNGSYSHWRHQDDYSHEQGGSLKRQKTSQNQRLHPSNSLDVTVESPYHYLQDSSYLDTAGQTSSTRNVVQSGFPLLPQGFSSSVQSCFPADEQCFAAQLADAEASATCTMTNDTVSPRSEQPLLETNNWTPGSQGGASEFDLGSPDSLGFDFGFDNAFQFGDLSSNMLMFGDPGRNDNFNVPFTQEPMADAENRHFTFLDLEIPQTGAVRPFTPIVDFPAWPYNEPWHPHPPVNYEITKPLNNELSRETSIPANGHVILQKPIVSKEPRALQPSKMIPIKPQGTSWAPPLTGREPKTRKPGSRSGKLPAKTRENANLMRSIGSCWPCRLMKVTCSNDRPCIQCLKPTIPRICYRAPLDSYSKAFMPDLVYSRLKKPYVTDLVRRVAIFTGRTTKVEMCSGHSYPPIPLTITEYYPRDENFLVLDFMEPKGSRDGRDQKPTRSYAPPFGLDDASLEGLKDACFSHIMSIINRRRDIDEVDGGDVSMISWKVFEAVNKYRRICQGTDNSELLENAAMLHAIHYFMSRIIVFSDASAEKVVEKLQRPHKLRFAPVLTSRLLNLQIKQVMHSLLCEKARVVLKGLERIMSRPKANWVDAFCVVLVLCICVEAVQVASDSYAMAALRKDPKCGVSREDVCCRLDEDVFAHLMNLFHMAFKTHKLSKKSTLRFNPIRYGLAPNENDGITSQMVNLVNDIKIIMKDYGNEMAEVAEAPSFDSNPDPLTQHMYFRKRNSGRLVSRFLLSFM